MAYVAATRARDLLVVPAVGDEPFPDEGWLSPLNKAIYPSRANWRKSRAGARMSGVRRGERAVDGRSNTIGRRSFRCGRV